MMSIQFRDQTFHLGDPNIIMKISIALHAFLWKQCRLFMFVCLCCFCPARDSLAHVEASPMSVKGCGFMFSSYDRENEINVNPTLINI